eukprot:SAG31_NODE_32363_length_357_cov_0.558140_1_plen_34_part_01
MIVKVMIVKVMWAATAAPPWVISPECSGDAGEYA